MSNLPLKELKPEMAMKQNFKGFDITEKKDGTLIFYRDGKLFSPRCERSNRFKHILKILKDNNFPNCFGEMFVEIPESICPECLGKSKELNIRDESI